MVEDSADNSALNSRRSIRNTYANLLLYYKKRGVGEVSQVAGAIITDVLINAIERRYKQLGGNTELLYLRAALPVSNGQLKKREPRDEHK